MNLQLSNGIILIVSYIVLLNKLSQICFYIAMVLCQLKKWSMSPFELQMINIEFKIFKFLLIYLSDQLIYFFYKASSWVHTMRVDASSPTYNWVISHYSFLASYSVHHFNFISHLFKNIHKSEMIIFFFFKQPTLICVTCLKEIHI